MLVRACIVHKESPPREQCMQLVMTLWRHPNSSIRHAALKGFDMLCKSNIPEIMKLVGSNSGSGSSKESSTLVVKVNQRLQEQDCDDEDRQLLNVLLSWFYSSTG